MAESAFVGRDSELETLWTAFGRARGGSGGIVVLSGEAGMGKTRLAREFARGVKATGTAVAWGRCYEGEWTPPLTPWGEAVGEVLPAEHQPDDLALLANILPQRHSHPIAPHAVHLTGEDERMRVFDAVTRLLLDESTRRPLVVVIDDIQWSDQVSLDMLRHFAFYVPRRAVVLLVLDRTGEPNRPPWLDDGLSWIRMEIGATVLALEGLPVPAIAQLVDAHGVRSPGIAATLALQTSGNPFYIGEMISHGLAEGTAHLDPGVDLAIPENVRFVVSRRLQRLAAPTQAILSRAAVFANGFDLPVLQRMIDATEDQLLDSLDEALAARFIQPLPGRLERYDFVHAIVRQCISSTWNPSRRVRLHRQAAEAIEAVYAGRTQPVSAEIAVQYHRSLSLPGAIAGLPHALQVILECHEHCTPEHAVTFLRIARDLSREGPLDQQASIVGQLSSAEAEIVLVDESLATLEEYLALAHEANLPTLEVAERLDILARSLKYSAYAGERCWRPVVERALKMVGPEDGRVWARLQLMLDPVEPLSRSGIRVGRWRGFDPVAVKILRSSGDDDDAARSMESFDAASRAETDAYLTRCRGWSSPTAVMYGLTVAANHYQYRHGAFRDARLLWQELVDLSSRASALHWQQQATNQLTYLLIAEGAFAEAAEMEAAANALSTRLGPGQHPAAHELEMETCRAIYQGGEWADIARRWRDMLDDPTFGPHDLATLTGAFYGGLAAYCFACAGDVESTASLLEMVTPLIEQMGPADANHNGAVAFAAAAVWRSRANQLAPVYRRLAMELIESGVGDYPQTSIQLELGRMAALMNRRPEATAAFMAARRAVSANGQAPMTPVIDFAEAEALVLWADPSEYDRILALIASARHRFLEFEMTPWLEELERLATEAETTLGGRKTLPAGITDREADVLRLIARGMSDRQVGDELYVSPRTVNAHVRNMLSKTGAANRVELAMWARNAGIVTS